MTDRLRSLIHDLMLIPGLSGYEGRVRRRLGASVAGVGRPSISNGVSGVNVIGANTVAPADCTPGTSFKRSNTRSKVAAGSGLMAHNGTP